MRAYEKTITKAEFIKELTWHKEQDNFIRGTYFKNGKGCAVGCSLQSVSKIKGIKLKHDNHREYENHLGIPEWLAILEDYLFENMSNEKSKSWPLDFAKAINVGADLNKVKTPFIVMVLEHSIASMKACVFDRDSNPEVVKALKYSEAVLMQMIEAQKSGCQDKIESAMSAAWSAAWSARLAESVMSEAMSAARSAARSAVMSAAMSARLAESVMSAARSAAWSARLAARSARLAARSARLAAMSARSVVIDYYADRLLEILKETKE